jgi:hypothetical protein
MHPSAIGCAQVTCLVLSLLLLLLLLFLSSGEPEAVCA